MSAPATQSSLDCVPGPSHTHSYNPEHLSLASWCSRPLGTPFLSLSRNLSVTGSSFLSPSRWNRGTQPIGFVPWASSNFPHPPWPSSVHLLTFLGSSICLVYPLPASSPSPHPINPGSKFLWGHLLSRPSFLLLQDQLRAAGHSKMGMVSAQDVLATIGTTGTYTGALDCP